MKYDLRNFIPQGEKEQELVINGKVVGFMKTYIKPDGDRYHAGIDFKLPGAMGLIQGHGMTPEEAILDAIKSGRSNAITLLNEIQLFEEMLGKE